MAREVQIEALVENEPIGRLRKLLILLIAATIIIDGFDIQMIAFVSPVLIEEWGVTKADLAWAVSAALAGMAIGAPCGGWLGDTWGRRKAIILSVLLFGLATLAAAWASSVPELAVLRLIGGLGFGAVLPNATALIAEWMPAKLRSYMISLMIVGVPLGGMLSASISGLLIGQYGWQACFAFGGALGIALSLVLLFLLPESPQFLLKAKGATAPVASLLGKAFPHLAFAPDDDIRMREAGRSGWHKIFSAEMARSTAGLTLAFVMNLLVFYAYANWIPTILTARGLPLSAALQSAMVYNLCGLLGAIVVAYIVSRFGSKRGMVMVLLTGAAASVLLGVVLSAAQLDLALLRLGLGVAGAALAGLQVGLYSLAAGVYPTDCRSTGIGFAAGIGRTGPIVSAFAGGLLLDLPNGLTWFTVLSVSALAMAIVGVLMVNRHSSVAS